MMLESSLRGPRGQLRWSVPDHAVDWERAHFLNWVNSLYSECLKGLAFSYFSSKTRVFSAISYELSDNSKSCLFQGRVKLSTLASSCLLHITAQVDVLKAKGVQRNEHYKYRMQMEPLPIPSYLSLSLFSLEMYCTSQPHFKVNGYLYCRL